MNSEEQQFLNDLDKKLWTAANKLLPMLDAAVYKHVVLGLIFLKYVSDAFKERRAELEAAFRDPQHDYCLGEDAGDLIRDELEARDYYTEKNVFWVSALARWDFIQSHAKVALGTVLQVKNGKTTEYKFNGIGRLLDDALEAVEKENPKLKGVLEKDYARKQIDSALPGLIDLIAEIPFHHGTLKAKDILGHVYEYFLGEFAIAEGKKGGQYYTPKSIVSLIVEMLQPYQGRVYDPCCGSGGFFVQSEKFVEEHGGRLGQISIYGQESNPTTWRLASMNMAIRGMDFDFGREPANTFSRDQHPDLRADTIMANPPFNMKEWNAGVKDDDPRWKYGIPPAGNANFAWMQHMIHHLAPHGSMALLLANGSMSSNTNNEGEIRKALIEADLVECMVALPGQLFTNTQIPACIWFLTKNKSPSPTGRGVRGEGTRGEVELGTRDRRGEVLFIDARKLGYMKDRVLRDFSADDIRKVAGTFHAWKSLPSPSGNTVETSNPLPSGEGRVRAESPVETKSVRQTERANPLTPIPTQEPTRRSGLQPANGPDRGLKPAPTDATGSSGPFGAGDAFWSLPEGEGLKSTASTATISRRDRAYQDIPGFCKSATLEDIRRHDYVLTPGRYVGAAEQEADGEPFEVKMARLTAQLDEQFAESARLEILIRQNLAGLGFGMEEPR